jgi:hypothetical protein
MSPQSHLYVGVIEVVSGAGQGGDQAGATYPGCEDASHPQSSVVGGATAVNGDIERGDQEDEIS